MNEEELAKQLYERYHDSDRFIGMNMRHPDIEIICGMEYTDENQARSKVIWVYKGFACTEILEQGTCNWEAGYQWCWSIERTKKKYNPKDADPPRVAEYPSVKWEDLEETDKHFWLEDARKFMEDM